MTLTALSEVLESRKALFSECFQCGNRADFANLSLNPSRIHFWTLWAALGPLLGHSWATLGRLLVDCGSLLCALGSSWVAIEPLGALLGSSWWLLDGSWAALGPSTAALGHPERVWEGPQLHFGSYLVMCRDHVARSCCLIMFLAHVS